MNVFSFRAECQHDVENLKNRLNAEGFHAPQWKMRPWHGFPDVHVEILANCNLNQLIECASKIQDSHVMVETFKQCALELNNLERDKTRSGLTEEDLKNIKDMVAHYNQGPNYFPVFKR